MQFLNIHDKQILTLKMIAKRVAGYVSAFTLYSSVRPFGLSTVLGVVDKEGPAIYMIEPSGLYYVCHHHLFLGI